MPQASAHTGTVCGLTADETAQRYLTKKGLDASAVRHGVEEAAAVRTEEDRAPPVPRTLPG